MPRLAQPPRGSTLDRLGTMLPHSIVLRRAGVNVDAQNFHVDFSVAARDALLGAGAGSAGYNGEMDSAAVYCLPTADIAVGDVFRFANATYTVMFVGPAGWSPVGGGTDTLVVAWARATKAKGLGA